MFGSNISLIDAAAAGDLPAVETLIAQGADLEVRDDCGRTPLHATMMGMHTGSGRDYPEKIACAKALLAAGANPRALGLGGRDVMYHGVSSRCSDLVKELKARGLPILPSCSLLEFIDRWPRGMFISAVEESKIILQMMFEEQPDLDQRSDDEHRRTALLMACGRGNHAAIEMLLSVGADPNATDSKGSTPLEYLTNYAWRSQTDCLFSRLVSRIYGDTQALATCQVYDIALLAGISAS